VISIDAPFIRLPVTRADKSRRIAREREVGRWTGVADLGDGIEDLGEEFGDVGGGAEGMDAEDKQWLEKRRALAKHMNRVEQVFAPAILPSSLLTMKVPHS
jgi:hypothetical protein